MQYSFILCLANYDLFFADGSHFWNLYDLISSIGKFGWEVTQVSLTLLSTNSLLIQKFLSGSSSHRYLKDISSVLNYNNSHGDYFNPSLKTDLNIQ